MVKGIVLYGIQPAPGLGQKRIFPRYLPPPLRRLRHIIVEDPMLINLYTAADPIQELTKWEPKNETRNSVRPFFIQTPTPIPISSVP